MGWNKQFWRVTKRQSILFYAICLVMHLQAAAPFVDAASTGGIANENAGSHTSLVNPNATEEAKGLMRYLSAIYGSYVLSGHQASYTWSTAESELASIQSWTGESPAVRGFDFMDVINGWGAPHAAEAIKWAKETGGIVHLCWHWRLGGGDFYSPAHNGNKSFPDGAPETNSQINADLEKLGDELQKFADEDIPVLWRPLHEPPGNWFWWHTAGSAQYVRLWRHMYDYLVNTRGLNNLIWVYSGADNSGYRDPNWYPGNDVVDIAGVDGYGEQWQTYWDGLYTLTNSGSKMVAMTENKKFPPWSTSHHWLFTTGWNNEIFQSLSQDDFINHYNHPNTINLDGLPTYSANQAPASWRQMLVNEPIEPADTNNIAPQAQVLVSSTDEVAHAAQNAIDENASTRWSSEYLDDQWIELSWLEQQVVNRIELHWEVAYADAYEIQANVGGQWITIFTENNGNGGVDSIEIAPMLLSGVRITASSRATQYGISLYEVKVLKTEEEPVIVLQKVAKPHFNYWRNGHSVIVQAKEGTLVQMLDMQGNVLFSEYANHNGIMELKQPAQVVFLTVKKNAYLETVTLSPVKK
jgi:hypothetical protein